MNLEEYAAKSVLLKPASVPIPQSRVCMTAEDAADALACAICHAHGGQGLGSISTAGYRMKGGRLV